VSRITRFFRILWHRREMNRILEELGLDSIAELDELRSRPLTATDKRFLETRERIFDAP
jgi:hypothetical protein